MEQNRGFIGYLILTLGALALLKYFFDWSIFDAADTERGRETIRYIREVLSLTWSYLAIPAQFIWEYAILPIIEMLKRD